MISCDADCQPSDVQVLRELLQEHGSLDSDGVLRGGLSLRHHEVRLFTVSSHFSLVVQVEKEDFDRGANRNRA